MDGRHDFSIPPCFDQGESSTERLTEMFVHLGQAKRIANGQHPAERAVFRKVHGVAHGQLELLDETPDEWRVGIFAHDQLDAWVRFSSDTTPTAPDSRTTLGIGIKLFGVNAPTAFGDAVGTADLVMQNHHVFFVDDAAEMVRFTYAGVVQRDYPGYLAQHPETDRILDDMSHSEGSVLTASYWAILPFRFGDRVVKYQLTPELKPCNVPDDAADYLRVDLARRLREREHTFLLSIQPRTNPETMPLDQATMPWPESESGYRPIARLRLPVQDVETQGQCDYGQFLSFNIWHVPDVNAPSSESSIAMARRGVYAAGARLRHEANGQPLDEPTAPRPFHPPSLEPDDCIVKAVIYPSIGVARVGNSTDEYLIGPEVCDPQPLPPGSYRDDAGRLKRQAARFRIYGVNALGQIVRELTADQAGVDLTWRAELANTKSAWYGFQLALDVPEAASAPPTTLRNPAVADRTALSITPGGRAIRGAEAEPVAFDTGTFMGSRVYLGELRTDDAGRLIVLGGFGRSGSYDGTRAVTFANNEGWYDDVSDGPVSAEVSMDGVALEVVPSWVVVAPPDFAPVRKSVRTMWDLMRDLAITAGSLPRPTRPSFTHDILPIFHRMSGLQWVNAGFAAGFGWQGSFDLTSPDALARLASPSPAHRAVRHTVARTFRTEGGDGMSPTPWPWIYGDAMNNPPVDTPRQNAFLTETQMWMLYQWAEGSFDADYDSARVPPRTIDEVPLTDQGDMLTRAALEFCLADAFHPGCEMTWPVRAWSMYLAPFRFLHAGRSWRPPSLGSVLTSDSVTIPSGPLAGQEPGGITRWMAVPWQTDTASCRSGYSRAYDPYLPTFWPATVPNHVLTKENYDIVVNESEPATDRATAFTGRAAWIEPLGAESYTNQINNMIDHFDHLGVVEARPGPSDAAFPETLEVEDRHLPIPSGDAEAAETGARRLGASGSPSGSGVSVRRTPRPSATDVDVSGIEKVRRFPSGLHS